MAGESRFQPTMSPFSLQQLEAVVKANPQVTAATMQQFGLAMYGSAMLQIQAWETLLAGLVLAATYRPRTSSNLRRRLDKQFRQIRHLMETATPQWMRKQLEGKVDASLLDEIDYLLPWRNTLAHRYLRLRIVDLPTQEIRVETDVPFELLDLCNAFIASMGRIEAATQHALAHLDKPENVPDEFIAGVKELTAAVAFAPLARFQPRDFSGKDES